VKFVKSAISRRVTEDLDDGASEIEEVTETGEDA
jgi:hypothetical protein